LKCQAAISSNGLNARNNVGCKAEEDARTDDVPAFNYVGGHVGAANFQATLQMPNRTTAQQPDCYNSRLSGE